jgi:hypothetical protein
VLRSFFNPSTVYVLKCGDSNIEELNLIKEGLNLLCYAQSKSKAKSKDCKILNIPSQVYRYKTPTHVFIREISTTFAESNCCQNTSRNLHREIPQ